MAPIVPDNVPAELDTANLDTACAGAARGWDGAALLSARLKLRALTAQDADAIADLAGDWEVARFSAHIPHPYDSAMALDFIAEAERRNHAGLSVTLGLERNLDGRLIGGIAAEISHGQAEIGYWLGRDFWGQGFAVEAIRRLLRLIFLKFPITQAFARVRIGNEPSAKVLAQAGFTETGRFIEQAEGRCKGHEVREFRLSAQAWHQAWRARPHVFVAAAALVDPDGRVLMATRPPGKTMAGLWEFPGGKVQPGETPEEALVRELKEELAIDTAESCLAPLAFASHDYDTFHLLMPLYVIRQWVGSVMALEGQGLSWVKPNRMGQLALPPADIPLVAILREWVS